MKDREIAKRFRHALELAKIAAEILPTANALKVGIDVAFDKRFEAWPPEPEVQDALNEDRDLTPKNLKEFRLKLFNDPVAYAYYNMGATVERDKRLSPEERTRKNWDAIYSAISCGFENKILPDIWTAEFAATDKDKP